MSINGWFLPPWELIVQSIIAYCLHEDNVAIVLNTSERLYTFKRL